MHVRAMVSILLLVALSMIVRLRGLASQLYVQISAGSSPFLNRGGFFSRATGMTVGNPLRSRAPPEQPLAAQPVDTVPRPGRARLIARAHPETVPSGCVDV